MDKLSFFLLALKAEMFCRKDWVIKCFSVFYEEAEDYLKDPFPYRIIQLEKTYGFINPVGDSFEIIPITDSVLNVPLFTPTELISITKGSVPNLKEDVVTTYGELFYNYAVLCYAFNDIIPYQNHEIKPTKIEALIEELLEDDLPVGEPPVAGKIYVSMYKKFAEATFQLGGYNELFVPSASPKTLTGHPDGKKLRDKLLAENASMLHDPATIARIDKQLEELDRSWVDDDGKDFYIKDKAYSNTRKKMFYMHGIEKPFTEGDAPVLITNSLAEGWDFNKLPAMANSLREGSYNRGSETQLGGVAAKEAFRAFQNVAIGEKDCGSKLGWARTISTTNASKYIGFYYLVNDLPVEITKENIVELIGKTINIRSPMLCKTSYTDFCEVCMGKQNSMNPTGLNALAQAVGSQFLSVFMKKMHVTSLALARYDFKSAIR